MNKTVREMAEELGVTKQTIQYHLKFLATKETTKSDKNHLLIKPNGQKFLREKIQAKNDRYGNKKMTKETISLSVVELLDKQLMEVNAQLKEKDRQLALMQKLLDQQQQLFLKEQQKNQIFLEESKETTEFNSKGFFHRLFRK